MNTNNISDKEKISILERLLEEARALKGTLASMPAFHGGGFLLDGPRSCLYEILCEVKHLTGEDFIRSIHYSGLQDETPINMIGSEMKQLLKDVVNIEEFLYKEINKRKTTPIYLESKDELHKQGRKEMGKAAEENKNMKPKEHKQLLEKIEKFFSANLSTVESNPNPSRLNDANMEYNDLLSEASRVMGESYSPEIPQAEYFEDLTPAYIMKDAAKIKSHMEFIKRRIEQIVSAEQNQRLSIKRTDGEKNKHLSLEKNTFSVTVILPKSASKGPEFFDEDNTC